MLVFWDERLVFLAVPKTGTTAIEGALAPRATMVVRDPPILKHAPLYRYRRLVEPFLLKAGDVTLETVAMVRHPIDWLGSWYRYRNRDQLVGHPNSTRGVTFDQFVDEYCKGSPAKFADVGSQAKFMSAGANQQPVTHLFRYEQQDHLLRFLEERLSTTIDLKQLNVSPTIPTPLSQDTEDKFRRKRAEEFDLWEQAGR
jgi:hypothetical protein